MTPATHSLFAVVRRWSPGVVLAAVRFYQSALRPLNPWGCKFYPSCSNYALEAVERYGLGQGGWLAVRRLLRCCPGLPGGYDPVPESPRKGLSAMAGPEPRGFGRQRPAG